MSKYLVIVFVVAVIGMIFTYQNCAKPSKPGEASSGGSLTFTGTVKTLDLENCGKVIVSEEDKTSTFIPFGIDLKNVPEQAKVEVTGTVAQDMVSTCMVGVILKVNKIDMITAAGTKMPVDPTTHPVDPIRLPAEEEKVIVY